MPMACSSVGAFFLQKNYIREETVERMRLDEEVIMDFFREYIGVTVSIYHLLLIYTT